MIDEEIKKNLEHAKAEGRVLEEAIEKAEQKRGQTLYMRNEIVRRIGWQIRNGDVLLSTGVLDYDEDPTHYRRHHQATIKNVARQECILVVDEIAHEICAELHQRIRDLENESLRNSTEITKLTEALEAQKADPTNDEEQEEKK